MSSKSKRRQELEAALNAAMRDVSGQGVLYSQAVAQRLGMNSTDLECLDHILRGPVTAGRLAEVTGLTSGAITGVIDRLERIGLARRERDADDRRRILIRALPAVGQRVAPLFEPMHGRAQITEVRDAQGVPHQTINALFQYLKRKSLVSKVGEALRSPYLLTDRGREALAELHSRRNVLRAQPRARTGVSSIHYL